MLVELKFKDNQNWTTISGNVIDWSNYSKKFKESRIQPQYIAPEITLGQWNGIDHDVQHVTWDSYYFQLNLKESEIHELVKLKSCKDIQIIEYTEYNSSIINKSYTLDITKQDLFDISEPQRIGNTTSWVVDIKFRTNRTVIYKGKSILNTNQIKLGSYQYFTDFDILTFNKDEASINYDWSDNSKRLLRTINKKGYQALLYLEKSDFETFINNWKYVSIATIGTNTINEIELETNQIAQNYYKVILKGVNDIDITDFYSSFANSYYLSISNGLGTSTYYTEYPIEEISEAPILNQFDNGNGILVSSRNITKKVKRIKFFKNESDAFSLKRMFEYGGNISLNGETITEIKNVEPVKLGYNLYEVNIDCLTNTYYES